MDEAILTEGHKNIAKKIFHFVKECARVNVLFSKIRLSHFVFGAEKSVFHLPIELSECCYVSDTPPDDYNENIYYMIYEKLLTYLQKLIKANKAKSLLYTDPDALRISGNKKYIYQGKNSKIYTR